MKKRSKKYLEAAKKVDPKKVYSIDDAVKLVKETSFTKFDETVDVAFRLGVDPRHADQMIRGAISLPAGTGKSVRVVVITSGEKIGQAEAAGADFSGGDDIIQKISTGWMDFDRVIASPDMMGKLGKIGRLLGPRGLMPNPKLGTVTTDVVKAVKEQKAGIVEYRTEKSGIVHVPIGKRSFDAAKIKENFNAIIAAIVKAKPSSAKGTYLKSLYISTTMGPSICVDAQEALQVS
ncbi:MAG: 50S ribosomal protein L1 [Bdellovibrionales bacterium RIFOXYD12_FULL_39_22]|nr:MAG: 50S ribosomal protein L1 [Bdellovibrionales bacterium RIFOXYB1_FULL_39_21]OFZ42094.1 MAG: 50S ribosomal protein L1 [Bdellovibrionales bacterium RIFOXYC12_FULL_39_17]OFZ50810.1 MAG: 50S ribosomal protein L1 [Bdellovibrionales bacterium RIFOXYC1_FULL_39_130]OFZ78033.1 MAG: 50S ribosomal protein L1 [Bdellovibrionales bacterium RIFOXYD1_FULL_39_84]OFZ93531.1 MAG: 50S ribosomal protein L1 [Bdellovibrionales bacterium RIFOXYD12_FULL_39_22]HLE10348.1 50S ribosomal protein L1 [Bacteriovoracace